MREIQERCQPNETYAKYATALFTMMQRAGRFTQAEKMDRLYENLRAKYKLYVRLNDATDLADLADQAAEFKDISGPGRVKPGPRNGKSTPPLPPTPRPMTEQPPAGDANSEAIVTSSARDPHKSSVCSTGKMAFPKTVTPGRETPHKPVTRPLLGPSSFELYTVAACPSMLATPDLGIAGHRSRDIDHQPPSSRIRKRVTYMARRVRGGHTPSQWHHRHDTRTSQASPPNC